MYLPSSVTDLWEHEHGDCRADPVMELSRDRANFILCKHAGHGGQCRQYLAALNRLSSVLG